MKYHVVCVKHAKATAYVHDCNPFGFIFAVLAIPNKTRLALALKASIGVLAKRILRAVVGIQGALVDVDTTI
ncbi:MAG: hypothetical protein BWX66_01782 [Deltaproteobacteria bacterium ADurb.Bin058]|jgi:hypothetical protein|nr:MAG: hypothetical protein BWX66_01782 [Deltaproteobacteria bacterium ADurb.Bin058]